MLHVQGLSKRFGDLQAVDDVSFQVKPGRLVGFLGPNGAGKSTTMRSLFELVIPDSGTLTWKGEPVSHSLNRFGYMPEQRGMYPRMKAAEQVAFFAQLKGLDQKLARANAEDLLTEFGLDERLNDEVDKLSHGNQQRVQLAMSMAHDPDLLVLDEPFSGLDPRAVDTMQNLLRERTRSGIAVLFSSHQLDLVERFCDDVIIIAGGKIRLQGSVNKVRRSGAQPSVRIEVDTPLVPLAETLTNYTVLESSTRSAKVAVSGPADLDGLLAAVRSTGEPSLFSFEPPTLTEVFAEIVQ